MQSYHGMIDCTSGALPQKIIFLILNQNICCGYSKEPSSFDHLKHMLNGKKISTILCSNFVYLTMWCF